MNGRNKCCIKINFGNVVAKIKPKYVNILYRRALPSG